MANGARRRRSGGGARRSGGGGARRGGGGRRSGGGGRRGGGGSNAMPMVVAGVIVVVVIVVIALANKPKKTKKEYVSTELTADSKVDEPGRPDEPKRLPAPDIPDDIRDMAQEIVANMEQVRPKADALFDEGVKAKQANDLEKWKEKMGEAVELYVGIQVEWNGLVEEVMGLGIENNDWDAEQIVNHHLASEGGKITDALKKLAYIKKQLPAD